MERVITFDRIDVQKYAVRLNWVVVGTVWRNRHGWVWDCKTRLAQGLEKTRQDAAEMIVYNHERGSK